MRVYYNENNAYCAAWLRNLMRAGEIPRGDVDERDIRDVLPSDVAGYDQCHWFAGLGGWPYALRLAGWDRPCWTGSCPCQPFSSAGKRLGFEDERHLWPAWRGLIAECRPPVVFGEQVSRATEWLTLVHGDLEAMGYAVGCMPIEAASVGARHKRDRFWFVADADIARAQSGRELPQSDDIDDGRSRNLVADADREPSIGSSISRPERDPWVVEPDVGRVAARIPEHVDQLRALGNSIVPQCGAAFVSAYMAWLDEQ